MDTVERLLNAVEWFVKMEESLMRFDLSPQTDRLPHEPAFPRMAILFDHPIDACDAIASAGVICRDHSVSLLPFTRELSIRGQRFMGEVTEWPLWRLWLCRFPT